MSRANLAQLDFPARGEISLPTVVGTVSLALSESAVSGLVSFAGSFWTVCNVETCGSVHRSFCSTTSSVSLFAEMSCRRSIPAFVQCVRST
jgi:hypothetical protein